MEARGERELMGERERSAYGYSGAGGIYPLKAARPSHRLCTILYARRAPKFQEPDQVFLDKVQRYLLTINPALNADDLIELRASRYRSAQPVCPPHYLDTLPPVELPVKGLWAADTSYYYPEDRGISESIEFGKKIATQAIA